MSIDSPLILTPPDSQFTIYFLHFENGLFNRHHYVGITRSERITDRLREHSRGHGSHITRALVRINETFTVAKLLHHQTYDDEKTIKRLGHYWKHCTLCNEKLHSKPICEITCADLEHQEMKAEGLTWATGLPTMKAKPP